MIREASSDPIRFFRFRNPKFRDLFRLVNKRLEVFVRSGNQAGKTTAGATLGVALARGIRMIDGEPVPPVQTPSVGFVVIRSYKAGIEASIGAYRKAIGAHPHHEVSTAGKLDYIGVIYVKPDDCDTDDYRQWSKIHFIPEGGQIPEGARIDWAHGDEPPDENLWREIRFRGKANEWFVRFITATPLYRSQWDWLRRDFPFEALKPKDGRATVISRVYDNTALTYEHLAELEALVRNDPLEAARLNGDFVDVEGRCPFPDELLKRWAGRSRDPEPVEVMIQKELEGDGTRVLVNVTATFQRWEPYDPNESYIGVIDPSLGIEDRLHDPGCIHIYARRRPRLVARWNGYLPGGATGQLAAIMGRMYGKAALDCDMTGGYGEAVMNRLTLDEKYSNIVMDDYADRPGTFAQRLGFKITAANRMEIISAIQEALVQDSIIVPCGEVIECLKNVAYDANNKALAVPGQHDEDMICLGRAAHLMKYRLPALVRKPRQVAMKDMILRAMGVTPKVKTPEAVEAAWE